MSARVLGVAGVGLIGGSIARDARAAGFTVIGFDRDPGTLAAAQSAGAIDDRAANLATLAARCEMLVIALPVDATMAALRDVPELTLPGVVFDVASVKGPVVRAAAGVPAFVGSHPLAGREIGGFGASTTGLFVDRPWAIVPSSSTAAEKALTAFVGSLGARPVSIAADDHDRIVALTSHVPQSVSVALATLLASRLALDPRVADLCGPGVASMLRLAHSPAGLWEPILAANGAAVAAELRALAMLLTDAASGLETGKREVLMSYFTAGAPAIAAMERSDFAGRSLPQSVSSR